MYPTQTQSEESIERPAQAFTTIDDCHKELERMQNKLTPILSSGADKLAGETPSMTELDSRLGQLLTHIRDISKRIKL